MGYLEIIGAGFIWALSGPLLRALQIEGFDTWDVLLGRTALGILFMGIWLMAQNRKRKKNEGRSDNVHRHLLVPLREDIAIFGILGFVAIVLSQSSFFYALSNINVAVAVTLNYTAPFFVMVLSYFLYRDEITKIKLFSLIFAIFGVALVSGLITPGTKLDISTTGILAGILSGFSYALVTIIFKRIGTTYGPVTVNFWTMISGLISLSVILTIAHGTIPPIINKCLTISPKALVLLTAMGLGPGTMAYILFADGITKVDATRGSIAAMIEPIAACILGYLLLEEHLALSQLIGMCMIIGAIWTVSISHAQKTKSGERKVNSM
jgi:DME family drug/metabolite transporter